MDDILVHLALKLLVKTDPLNFVVNTALLCLLRNLMNQTLLQLGTVKNMII